MGEDNFMPTLSDQEIKQRVERALGHVLTNQQDSLIRVVGERNITSYLSSYLGKEFPEYNVDHEYDRQGDDRKKIQKRPFRSEQSFVTPDVVIHKQGIPSNNLLVIQAKLLSRLTPTNRLQDLHYLRRMTDLNGTYHYRFGIFILFNVLEFPELIWYENGRQRPAP